MNLWYFKSKSLKLNIDVTDKIIYSRLIKIMIIVLIRFLYGYAYFIQWIIPLVIIHFAYISISDA